MAQNRKPNPRLEYLQQEQLRVRASPALSEKYPVIQKMTVEFDYQDLDRAGRGNQIKYFVNLETTKSIFRVGCQNPDCIGGGFDLSEIVGDSVSASQADVSGQICCQGFRVGRSESAKGAAKVPCRRVLNYRMTLSYQD